LWRDAQTDLDDVIELLAAEWVHEAFEFARLEDGPLLERLHRRLNIVAPLGFRHDRFCAFCEPREGLFAPKSRRTREKHEKKKKEAPNQTGWNTCKNPPSESTRSGNQIDEKQVELKSSRDLLLERVSAGRVPLNNSLGAVRSHHVRSK
jgi:hypothetical protein